MREQFELKPCPFCGGTSKPKGILIKTDRTGIWKHWYIGCVLDGFLIRDTEAWNRRTGEEA